MCHERRKVTGATTAEATIHECAELGIKQAWMHRSFGEGSVSEDATVYGREHGIAVIDGGCPLMFEPTADLAHKIMRFVCTRSGHVPQDGVNEPRIHGRRRHGEPRAATVEDCFVGVNSARVPHRGRGPPAPPPGGSVHRLMRSSR